MMIDDRTAALADLPAPPVPPDVDLTDFRFMPLEVVRLRKSKQWLIARRRPEVGFYALNVWMRAWQENPAGSIEDDDDVLADAAMCEPGRWPKVKADVMRGWIKCSDGRLYHHFVAAKVLEAWQRKLEERWTKECDRVRKENKKRKGTELPELPMPPKPTRKSGGDESEDRTTSDGTATEGERTAGGIPPENALKGQGQGQGQGKKEDSSVPPDDGIPVRRAGNSDGDPTETIIRVLDDAIAEHFPTPRPSRHPQDRAIARGWLERGVTAEFARDVIEPIVGRRAAEGQDAPQTLKFFLDPMIRAIAARGPAVAVTASPDPEHEVKAGRFNKAFLAWSHDGRQGQAPRPEDFGLPPFDTGRAA